MPKTRGREVAGLLHADAVLGKNVYTRSSGDDEENTKFLPTWIARPGLQLPRGL